MMYSCSCLSDFLKEQKIENMFTSDVKPDWSKYKPKCETTCGEKYKSTIVSGTIKNIQITEAIIGEKTL